MPPTVLRGALLPILLVAACTSDVPVPLSVHLPDSVPSELQASGREGLP